MRFCSVERRDFPDREFRKDQQGVLMHDPPGNEPPHPASIGSPRREPERPFRIASENEEDE